MDTVTAISERRLEALPDPLRAPAATKMLTVTATYLLSEEGARHRSSMAVTAKQCNSSRCRCQANRLHLVSVDAHGVARLKLRPRYQLDGDNGIVRIDTAPTYDKSPDVEELFREAARNHQLEGAYRAERHTAKIKRREADQDRRANVAKAFLADPTRRALAHPTPSPKRCLVETEDGRIFFDANADPAPAKDVPAEAHRRFRDDLRVTREQNLKTRAEQMAQHEEKKKFAADWIAAHGTPDQQVRQAAGVLSIEEAIDAMTDYAFGPLADRPRYVPDGVSRIQEALNGRMPAGSEATVSAADVAVSSTNAETMTAAQWAAITEIRRHFAGCDRGASPSQRFVEEGSNDCCAVLRHPRHPARRSIHGAARVRRRPKARAVAVRQMRRDIRQRASVSVDTRGVHATWPPEHLFSLTR